MNTTLELDWLARWARYTPHAVALKCGDTGRAYTYADMHAISQLVAGEIARRYRIVPGDRIALLATNELETHFLFFAAQRLGAILVPLNFRLAPRELDYILRDAEPKVLIYQREFESVHAELESAIPHIWLYDGDDSYLRFLEREFPTGMKTSDFPPFAAKFEDPCMILYTSGTTGRPKGAIITPKMLFWNSINTSLRLNIVPSDCYVSFLPLFHTSGWNVLTTPFFHHGARVVFLKKFDPDAVLRVSAAERATILFGVPTTMARMAETRAFTEADLSALRFAIVGGEAMPVQLIERWQAKNIPIRQGFGMTEFGPNVFSLNAEDSIRKIGSIGFPNFYIDVRIVDDEGRDVTVGEAGELLLRGPAMTPGYWRNPRATETAIQDGWFHTGDILRQDDDGYYYVVDRKKDMYISGGENVYPLEVEHFLRTHPAIAETAVVGVPDEKWGEVGKAFIVTQPNANLRSEDILEFCQGKLAKYKIPKHVAFVQALPKSDSGKILKRALREL